MQSTETIVQVRELTKIFVNKRVEHRALRGVSFRIRRGELVGYLGPNGAGKTTTIRILLKLLKPTDGDVSIHAQRISFVLDVPSLYPQLTLRDNLEFYCGFLHVPFENARRLLDQVQMLCHLDQKVGSFSLGMKKRAELTRALLNEPDFLVLDEPMSGLDPSAQAGLRDILVEQSKRGVSMLITSHDLYNLHRLAHRFLFIDRGRIHRDLPASEVTSSEMLEDIYHQTIGNFS